MTFTPVVVGTGIAAFTTLQRTQDAQVEAFRNASDISREVNYLKDNLAKVDSVDALLEDRTLLRVTLGAFGLDEDIDNKGFLRQVLTSDLNSSSSVANRLSDSRYLALARAFNFEGDTAQLPGTNPVEELQSVLQRIDDVDDLFSFANRNLLDRTLEVFGLTDQKDRTIFLKRVLTSDVDDPNSLANRLTDSNYAAMARAFQGKTIPLPAAFLSRFDSETAQQLQSISSPEELASNTPLLNKVFAEFGVSGRTVSSTILTAALNSDLSDPDAFVQRINVPGLKEMAEAFDFFGRNSQPITIYDFAETFDGALETLETADDLLDDKTLLNAALKIFGLGTNEPDTAFLRSVLNSDLTDENSVANSQADPRYAALSKAFGFGAIAAGEDRETAQFNVQFLIDRANAQGTPITDPELVLENLSISLATLRFFDLPDSAVGNTTFARALRSDPSSDLSVLNVVDDPRYETAYNALGLAQTQTGRTYPAGFSDAIADAYVERQFEVRVGELDPNMRIALSLERELGDLVDRVRSNDARWFSILGAPPLRAAFEAALNLPSNIGTLDTDRQLTEFKERAASVFGTSDIGEITGEAIFPQLQSRYLQGIELQALSGGSANPGNPYATALAVLGS